MDYEQLESYQHLLLLNVDIPDYSCAVKDDDYMLVKIDSSVEWLLKEKTKIPTNNYESLLGKYILLVNSVDSPSRAEAYLHNRNSKCISRAERIVLAAYDNLSRSCGLWKQETSSLTISLADIKDMVTILGYDRSMISINDIDVACILLELANLRDRKHIFRGINKIYDKDDGISSSNYRNNKKLEEHFPDLQKHEREIADKFKEKPYVSNKTYINALSVSRHLGSDTSFIDFTEDPMVALYFACQGIEHESVTGEIIYFNREALENKNILEEKREIKYTVNKDFIIRPTEDDLIKERVRAQKSIFVYACVGYLSRNEYQKAFHRLLINPLLKSFLSEKSGLCEDDIYPDKMGFFDNQENLMTYPARLYSAKMMMKKGEYKEALNILNECERNYGPNLNMNPLIDECKREIKRKDTRKFL